MNGTLGRDKVWNEHIWSEIDKAVRDEMGRIRVAQKVFPSTIVNNVQPVHVKRVQGFANLRIEDEFRPFIEMSMEFVLTQAQVDSEENMHLARTLAGLAARALAADEDTLLFLGRGLIHLLPATGVKVTNQGALPRGFVREALSLPRVIVRRSILGALARGIARLSGRNQPGPYALFFSPRQYARTFAPVSNDSLVTTADRIIPLVAGGFYSINSLIRSRTRLPYDIGILVSLGGEPTKIYLGADTTTAFTFTDADGNYKFRVFERIQLVVRDPAAFQILKFPLPGSPPEEGLSEEELSEEELSEEELSEEELPEEELPEEELPEERRDKRS
jgi:uncharacterized linocin/CFP29 family protein